MHICTRINNGNNDPIKVFMTFIICDDGMKNKIEKIMKVSKEKRNSLVCHLNQTS